MRINTVLLVDDDVVIRKLVQLSLEKFGKWQVIQAESGPAAIETVSRQNVDVILLDVMMPGMDGLAAFGKLREKIGNACPIIFFTGHTQTYEIDTYMHMGAAGVIAKPFDPVSLASTVQKLVNAEPVSLLDCA